VLGNGVGEVASQSPREIQETEEMLKRFARWIVVLTMLSLGCGQSEIKGTYEVELEIAGTAQPLAGILMLSTQILDVSPPTEGNEIIDSIWAGDDVLSANSCFILAPRLSSQESETGRAEGDGSSSEPSVIRIFEVRIQQGEVITPIEILNASDLRIEITKLQFFSGALGGELDVHTSRGIRPGRISGTRTKSASSQLCVESLAGFRAFLTSLQYGDATQP